MKTKVKIIDFNRRSMRREQAEQQLADLLDEGYSLITSTDNGTFASYTLIMREIGKESRADEKVPGAGFPAWLLHTGSPIAPRSTTTSVH